MSEFLTKSVAQEQQAQKIETRTAVARIAGFALIATAVAVLGVLGAAALFAQGQDKDKYSLDFGFHRLYRTSTFFVVISHVVDSSAHR
jgi:hypothetical protein